MRYIVTKNKCTQKQSKYPAKIFSVCFFNELVSISTQPQRERSRQMKHAIWRRLERSQAEVCIPRRGIVQLFLSLDQRQYCQKAQPRYATQSAVLLYGKSSVRLSVRDVEIS